MKPMQELLHYYEDKLTKQETGKKLKFYEEIRAGMIEPLNLKQNFHVAELVDGDIIIVEYELSEEESKQVAMPTVLKYFEEYENRVLVSFKPRWAEQPEQQQQQGEIQLALSRKQVYPQVKFYFYMIYAFL